MSWIAAIIVGAIIGLIAEKYESDMGLLMNIIIGIIGSSLGRWLFGDILGIGSAYAPAALILPVCCSAY